MSDIANRDQNHVPALQGVSSVDGISPTDIHVDPVTHGIVVDPSSLDNRFVNVTGDTMTGDLGFTDAGINEVDYVCFNKDYVESDLEQGCLYWDNDKRTLNLMLAGGTVIQIAQEQVLPDRPRNDSGVDITNGQAVYLSGATGAVPEVKLANASEVNATYTVAVATQDISDGNRGYYTTFGLVRSIDTSFGSAGDRVYLDITDGGLTTTEPSHPNYSIKIGAIIRSSATEGVLFVNIHSQEWKKLIQSSKLVYGFDYDQPDLRGDIDFTEGTRTFSIAPKAGQDYFNYWIRGEEYRKTAEETVVIDDTSGVWYIYYNGETLTASQTPWHFKDDYAFVSILYWNATDNKAILTNERHKNNIPRSMHEWAHDTFGARFDSGLTGTFDNTTFTIEEGEFHDEDIPHEISQQTTAKVLYKDGGTDEWTWEVLSTPYKAVGGVLQYYDDTNNLASVDNQKYTVSWVYATPDIDDPVHIYLSDAQYNTVALARETTQPSRDVLTSPEDKFIYKVIYENNNGTATFVEAEDFRTSAKGSSGITTDHSSLANLAWESSGHSGTVSTLAGFDTDGLADNVTVGTGLDLTGSILTTNDTEIVHNDLSGLQGGTTNEYYHLISSEHTELTAWLDDVTLTDGGDVNLGTGDLTAVDLIAGGIVYTDTITEKTTDNGITITDDTNFSENVTITGNLTVNGTEFITNTETVEIEDNLAIINSGETGAGITAGFAGWEADRGTLTDYRWGFDETDDLWKIGQVGDLQAVATRQDSPTNEGIAYWNSTNNRFDTSSNATLDSTGLLTTQHFVLGNNEQPVSPVRGQIYFDANFYPDFDEFDSDGGGLVVYDSTDGFGAILATNNMAFADAEFNTQTLNYSSGNPQLTLEGTTHNLTMYMDGGGDAYIQNDANNNGIVIYDGTGGVDINYYGSTKLTADNAGVDVTGLLDVSGNIYAGDSGESNSIIRWQNQDRVWEWYANSTADHFSIYDRTAGEYRLSVDYDGKVGIRTSPDYDLDVNGDGRFSGTIYADPSESAGSIAITFNHGYDIYVDNTGAGSDNTRFWLDTPADGEIVFGPRGAASRTQQIRYRAVDHLFETSGSVSTWTYIDENGVGIGTAPSSSYLLNVNGDVNLDNVRFSNDSYQITRNNTYGSLGDVTGQALNLIVDSNGNDGIKIGQQTGGPKFAIRTDTGDFWAEGDGHIDGTLTFTGFVDQTLEFTNADDTAATEEAWIQVRIGGSIVGYLRVYATT